LTIYDWIYDFRPRRVLSEATVMARICGINPEGDVLSLPKQMP